MSIIGLLLPNFSFAQNQTFPVPWTLEEARAFLERMFGIIKETLPTMIKKIWDEEVLPIWQKMFEWFKLNIWEKIKPGAEEELEKRKSILKEEFPKAKEELKKETPVVTKSLWEKLKELFQ